MNSFSGDLLQQTSHSQRRNRQSNRNHLLTNKDNRLSESIMHFIMTRKMYLHPQRQHQTYCHRQPRTSKKKPPSHYTTPLTTAPTVPPVVGPSTTGIITPTITSTPSRNLSADSGSLLSLCMKPCSFSKNEVSGLT